jgi:hypothetical protein
MKKSELKKLIRETIRGMCCPPKQRHPFEYPPEQKPTTEVLKTSLFDDKKIAKGLIGKILVDNKRGDKYKITGIHGYNDNYGHEFITKHNAWGTDVAVVFDAIMDSGSESKIELGIEAIMDLLMGKTAKKWGYDNLEIEKQPDEEANLL